ncbi:MAG: class I SAM-dependent methyltransferase, partial [Gemmatimonadaceae bacterium]
MTPPQRVQLGTGEAGIVQAPQVHHRRDRCRACGTAALRPFLSLGPQPLANAFLRRPEEFAEERFFPLDVYFCQTCSLVQLADVIDPEVLFGHYIYVTGTSETIAAHNVGYAQAVVDELTLGPADLVVELASNDGSLLTSFAGHGVRTLGVEPARNIAEMARARGIDTINRFFNGRMAHEVRSTYGPASAVIGNNVLAHVDDTQDFLAGARTLISDRGRVIVEVPYAKDMLDRREYDTIYHEHLCYFSVTALARLGAEVGLGVVRVDRVPVHGGSIRVWFAKDRPHDAAVERLIEEERRTGLTTLAAWEAFGRAAAENRTALRLLLEQLHGDGRTVAGYGAPAKGNTLLNYCGIDTTLLPYTVDRNAMKVG